MHKLEENKKYRTVLTVSFLLPAFADEQENKIRWVQYLLVIRERTGNSHSIKNAAHKFSNAAMVRSPLASFIATSHFFSNC